MCNEDIGQLKQQVVELLSRVGTLRDELEEVKRSANSTKEELWGSIRELRDRVEYLELNS